MALRLTPFLGLMLMLLVTFTTANRGGSYDRICKPCHQRYTHCHEICMASKDEKNGNKDWAVPWCSDYCCIEVRDKTCNGYCGFKKQCKT
ncbi:hypothetical protein C7974DRAFT_413850 [Boeremia exigua]|uniref:uncharacterized protein n=1 Tax=Boeremia exigua TaxID=749465 RepID=UPI001E8CF95F|nr:uncharacterized protein C7974DRAFT_413850 [Boeremia exigua]KAH6625322.1 hypothetical protein C7974DRAFT_413850 [Boeremia exigua]